MAYCSAKFWLNILNELKNRGVRDILIVCADNLPGIESAVRGAFPKSEIQICIVHQIRNSLILFSRIIYRIEDINKIQKEGRIAIRPYRIIYHNL